MKAAQLQAYGGHDSVRITDTEKPTPQAGHVLVEVHAASVNPFDWKVREGYMQQWAPLTFPATLGGDLAGVIIELGDGVNEFTVGQEVFGSANSVSGKGSFAEFAPASIKAITAKPTSLDFAQAAALPLAAASAYMAIVEVLAVRPKQRVLIHGGAGGIGSLAIQIAKHCGAYVAATAKTADIDYVRQCGADEAIDYRTEQFEQKLQGFDAVFDTVGGETYTRSFTVLKSGGAVASMVEKKNEALAAEYHVAAQHACEASTSLANKTI